MFRTLINIALLQLVFGDNEKESSASGDDSVDASETVIHEHMFWGYDDTSQWGKEYADCAANDESPIDIRPDYAIVDASECISQFDWSIEYNQHTFKIINNGHSLQLIAAEINKYSQWGLRRRLSDHKNTEKRRLKAFEYTPLYYNYNSIATFPDYFAPPDSEHTTFCLHSVHFHWGSTSGYGSEHTINEQYFPLEAHFVHYVCDAVSLEQALDDFSKEKDQHVLAVVAVLFEVSETNNPAFDAILDRKVLRKIEFPDDVKTVNITEGMAVIDDLDLRDLIPQDIDTVGYFAYEGSLTTPPCTDVVRWHVMNARGSISEEQLEKMRMLYDANGESIAPNYRSIQENVNGVWSCTSDTNAQQTNGININSQLFGTDIPTHASLNAIFLVIIVMGATIFVLLISVVCCFSYNQDAIYGTKRVAMQREDEIDDSSDTDPELESDVLINDQLS